MEGRQGWPRVSRCLSTSCPALVFWIKKSSYEHLEGETEMVYPQTGIRIPPPEGLEPEAIELYGLFGNEWGVGDLPGGVVIHQK